MSSSPVSFRDNPMMGGMDVFVPFAFLRRNIRGDFERVLSRWELMEGPKFKATRGEHGYAISVDYEERGRALQEIGASFARAANDVRDES